MALRWNEKVKKRDNYICRICGASGTDAHHILCAGWFPEEYYKLDNGITLCRKCHVLAHRGKFGATNKGKYTAEQTEQYLMERAGGKQDLKPLIRSLIEADIQAENTARGRRL